MLHQNIMSGYIKVEYWRNFTFLVPQKYLVMLQEGGPLPGPETGLLSNTWKWIVQGDMVTKQEILLGKGTQVESSR